MGDKDRINPNGQFVYFSITEKLQQIINEEFYQNDVIKFLINDMQMECFYLYLEINLFNLFNLSNSLQDILSVRCVQIIIIYYRKVLYYGKSKPKFLEKYLEPFIKEINILQKHGIGKNTYKVNLMAFIADTLARAFLKCIKSHCGYNACEHYTIPEELLKIDKSSKIIYPDIGYPMRTKESFFYARKS